MTYTQYNNTNLNAQFITVSDTIFDKIINNESFSVPAPDKFLESQGSFTPTVPTDLETQSFMATFGPVKVFSNNIKNNTRIIDFDQVPAITPTEFMRFMPPYQVLFHVYNNVTQNITINSIQIAEVETNQGESPFEFCGMDYNDISIRLLPGETQTFSICYYPNEIGTSNAKLLFYQGSQAIFGIPIKGNGIEPTRMPEEMGKANNRGSTDNATNLKENATSQLITKLPSGLLNMTFDSNSFLTVPVADCSVSIEGGGLRPDPAVHGYGPSNITPLSPNDDGIDTNESNVYHHSINVAELVKLKANVTGLPLSIQNIKWTIEEPKIKDYNESIPGKFEIYNLTSQDYSNSEISFYWKDIGEKEVTVTIEGISNDNQSKKCIVSRTFVVERNIDDINRQATDFYVFNHDATVLEEHLNWHFDNQQPEIPPCDPLKNGEKFFLFHKLVISNFDAWRDAFGYPRIAAWDPATNPPKTKDLDHENRSQIYEPLPIPSYYTPEGGNTNGPCFPYYKNDDKNLTKLSDYSSANHLASEIERFWHSAVHGTIAGNNGDMGDAGFAPKDPVFWMWHKYIDTIYDKYTEIKK